MAEGTLKKEVATIEIKGYEVREIIIDALIEKGYDIVAKPLLNDQYVLISETLTIYKTELRPPKPVNRY